MTAEEVAEALNRGYCGRISSIGADGWPYCIPMLYVWMDECVYFHGTSARGHLRANVDYSEKVCFEIDEPGEIFAYGRFECDTSVAYRSVIAFGRVRVVEDATTKPRFFDALMAKYAQPSWQRPKGFYPRMEGITLYAIEIERMSGKKLDLPDIAQQWPAMDRTKMPNARA